MSEKDFIGFITENQGIIHKICRIYTNNEADYEDLFQEIMLQLWQSIDQFEGKSKLTTWMYRVSLFTAITRLKKEQRRPATTANVPDMHDQPIDDEDQVEILLKVIQHLNEAERGLVMLYLEGKSYKEISTILGLTESNVGVRLNRIKAKLKEYLIQAS